MGFYLHRSTSIAGTANARSLRRNPPSSQACFPPVFPAFHIYLFLLASHWCDAHHPERSVLLCRIRSDKNVAAGLADAPSKSCLYLVFVIAVVYNPVSKYRGWLTLHDAPPSSSLVVPRLSSEFPFAQSIRMAAEMHFSDLSNLRERPSESW
mgnify:CR=1 FL=1